MSDAVQRRTHAEVPARPRIQVLEQRGTRPCNGLHVAIIMDGSGRWAEARRRPRLDGHRAGARVVRSLVERAPSLGVHTLTLFAFSADNWNRPQQEVHALMGLLRDFLLEVHPSFAERGVCIDVIGRRDRLSSELLDAIERAEKASLQAQQLHLRLAIDYSARDCILRAAQGCGGNLPMDREAFRNALALAEGATRTAPEVDLLIRTGGEQRLSDFLLWESAYAELYFTKRMWPEFGTTDLREAIREFHARERRFGALPGTAEA